MHLRFTTNLIGYLETPAKCGKPLLIKVRSIPGKLFNILQGIIARNRPIPLKELAFAKL